MNYKEALDYIYNAARLGSRLGLDRMRELLGKLDNPQDRVRTVHVAGTNGKGSTSSMTASILKSAGYKTGLYTSPYLYRFNERMQIDGEQIPDDELAEITTRVRELALSMEHEPTEFEIVTCIGFEYFAQNKCDYVVVEVGLGGRLDATNIIAAPDCCVITAIGLDHLDELGDTVEKIAWEKAGIVKPGGTVVVYDQDESIMEVIEAVCEERGATMYRTDFSKAVSISDTKDGQVFRYKDSAEYRVPLLGAHQLHNATAVLEAIDVLRTKGASISDEQIAAGLAATVWPARFEIMQRDPYFVVDGGHNPQCAETVAANLKNYFPDQKAVMMIGVLADKDYPELTSILNEVADSYVAVMPPDSSRALPYEDLAEYLKKQYGKPVVACATVEEGVAKAIEIAGQTTKLACAVGSLYMSGPIRATFGKY